MTTPETRAPAPLADATVEQIAREHFNHDWAEMGGEWEKIDESLRNAHRDTVRFVAARLVALAPQEQGPREPEPAACRSCGEMVRDNRLSIEMQLHRGCLELLLAAPLPSPSEEQGPQPEPEETGEGTRYAAWCAVRTVIELIERGRNAAAGKHLLKQAEKWLAGAAPLPSPEGRERRVFAGADRLALAVLRCVENGALDARSGPGDALLDYADTRFDVSDGTGINRLRALTSPTESRGPNDR